MRRAIWLGLAVLLASGCKAEKVAEPQFSRLEAGDEALAYDKNKGKVPIHEIPKGRGIAGAMDLNFVQVGTKVRAIEDAEPDFEPNPGSRLVSVIPLEGELEGVAGKMLRKNLRPTAKQ